MVTLEQARTFKKKQNKAPCSGKSVSHVSIAEASPCESFCILASTLSSAASPGATRALSFCLDSFLFLGRSTSRLAPCVGRCAGSCLGRLLCWHQHRAPWPASLPLEEASGEQNGLPQYFLIRCLTEVPGPACQWHFINIRGHSCSNLPSICSWVPGCLGFQPGDTSGCPFREISLSDRGGEIPLLLTQHSRQVGRDFSNVAKGTHPKPQK